jgi:hypothetical protein
VLKRVVADPVLAASHTPAARDVEGMKREALALEREVSDVAEQARRDRLFDLAVSARTKREDYVTPCTGAAMSSSPNANVLQRSVSRSTSSGTARAGLNKLEHSGRSSH